MSLVPFDLTEVIHQELTRQRRENDHLAHASSHLKGSLRHAQLDVAGAPKRTNPLLSEITLMTGTLWHEWIHDTLRRLGVPYMAEVNMTPWLPPGWAGTADALIWSPEHKAFVLRDFKTSKGESMRYIRQGGAKEEHIAQVSLYWHAAKKMGIPLVKEAEVYYLPKNDTRSKDEIVEPILASFTPLPAKQLHAEAKQRWGRISEYTRSLGGEPGQPTPKPDRPLKGWLTDELEPVQQRTQRVYFDRATGTHEVKLVPHWSAAFCPFPNELCDCSTQGTTKVGYFDIDGEWIPRKGYEDVELTVDPPAWQP